MQETNWVVKIMSIIEPRPHIYRLFLSSEWNNLYQEEIQGL